MYNECKESTVQWPVAIGLCYRAGGGIQITEEL